MEELLRSLRTSLSRGRLTILCGAGISHEAPSDLPLAFQLIEAARVEFLADFCKYVGRIEIRPEAFFEILSRTCKKELLGFLRRSLVSNSPNTNHYILAYCLGVGCNVITTNFDCLIELAAKRSGIRFGAGESRGRVAKHSWLLKVNGTIDQPESIALTVDHVGGPLTPVRAACFANLAAKRKLLVVGYSGLDQFDIMPALAASQYSEVIWVSHDPTRTKYQLRNQSPKSLREPPPRLVHLEANTGEFLRLLVPTSVRCPVRLHATPTAPVRRSISLSRSRRARITIDLLMHQDQYSQIPALIRKERLSRRWYFRIADFEARSITTPRRDRTWADSREQFRAALFSMPSDRRALYLPTLSKWTDTSSRLEIVRQVVMDELTKGHQTSTLLEAGAELLYELVERQEHGHADELVPLLRRAASQGSHIIAKARVALELSNFHLEKYERRRKDARLLHIADREARTALELFGAEFVNDKYFSFQALHTLARIHSLKGEFAEAVRLYKRCSHFFKLVEYQLSRTYAAVGQWRMALFHLSVCFRANKRSGRQYYLPFLLRLRAALRCRRPFSAARMRFAIKELHESITLFNEQHYRAQARATQTLRISISSLLKGGRPITIADILAQCA